MNNYVEHSVCPACCLQFFSSSSSSSFLCQRKYLSPTLCSSLDSLVWVRQCWRGWITRMQAHRPWCQGSQRQWTPGEGWLCYASLTQVSVVCLCNIGESHQKCVISFKPLAKFSFVRSLPLQVYTLVSSLPGPEKNRVYSKLECKEKKKIEKKH